MTNKKPGILDRDSFYIVLMAAHRHRLLRTAPLHRPDHPGLRRHHPVLLGSERGQGAVAAGVFPQLARHFPGELGHVERRRQDPGGGMERNRAPLPSLPDPALLSVSGQHCLAGGPGHVLGRRRNIPLLPSHRHRPVRRLHCRSSLRALHRERLAHQRRTHPEAGGDLLVAVGYSCYWRRRCEAAASFTTP